MSAKRNHLVKSQKVSEVNSDQGYWDFLDSQKHKNGAAGSEDLQEDKFANPDVLPESEGFFYQDPEKLAELKERAAVVQEACAKVLTALERQVVELLAAGKSLDSVAKELKKTKAAVQQTLIRAREKIRRFAIRRGV